MKPISRRALLAGSGVVAALPLISPPARAADYDLKFGHNSSVASPLHVQATRMAQQINAATNGRVNIQVFPSSQLGSDTDMLSQLRSGALEMMTLSGLILSTLVPAASINGIGFAFPDYDTVWKAMDGDLGAYVRGQIAKSGLVAMDRIWDNGFREITTSSKPIRTAADLAGLKIRVPVSPLWTSMFSALGASPTSINFSETYSALQTHIVDGQEQPLNVILTEKIYEVQKYCSLTNHMWDGFWFLVNGRVLAGLPDDLRSIVTTHINDAALQERTEVAKLNASAQGTLEGHGLTFNQTDPASFKDKLQAAGFYRKWKATYGDTAWALLEQASGKLT